MPICKNISFENYGNNSITSNSSTSSSLRITAYVCGSIAITLGICLMLYSYFKQPSGKSKIIMMTVGLIITISGIVIIVLGAVLHRNSKSDSSSSDCGKGGTLCKDAYVCMKSKGSPGTETDGQCVPCRPTS